MDKKTKIFRIKYGSNVQDYGTLKELYEENHMLIKISIGALMNSLCSNDGIWSNELVSIERKRIIPAIMNDGKLEAVKL